MKSIFSRILTDARNGFESVVEHICHATESEFHSLRSDFEERFNLLKVEAEQEIMTLKTRIAALEEKLKDKV